jgi:hypothetical protein
VKRLLPLLTLIACAPPSRPPAIAFSNVRVESVTANRAVVLFDTDVATSCQVMFGPTREDLGQIATDPDMMGASVALTHRVPLENLTAETTYFYRAMASGSVSELAQFATPKGAAITLANVALKSAGTSVSAVSSNYAGAANSGSFGADSAIDGDMTTEWSTDGNGDAAWIELDLGQSRALKKLGFRSREMMDGSSIIQRVRLVFDGAATQGPFETPDPTVRYLFDLTPVTARKVRLEAVKTSGGNTGAREIELY